MNKKTLLIGGAVLVALIPAALGLWANSSLSAEVPLNVQQVATSSSGSTAPASPTTITVTSTPGQAFTQSSPSFTTVTTSPSFDDHGGDRDRGDDDSGHRGGHGGDDDSGHHGGNSGHG